MNEQNNNNQNLSPGCIVVIFILIAVFMFSCGDCGGSNSGRKWSDLSDVEKDNARWAYEAKQAIDDYKR